MRRYSRPLQVEIVSPKRAWRRVERDESTEPEERPPWLSWMLLFSATRRIVERLKHGKAGEARSVVLDRWNWIWFVGEAILAGALIGLSLAHYGDCYRVLLCALLVFAWWRVNEVVYAFWKDSLDAVEGRPDASSLSSSKRLSMLARSASGLVFWFAVAYAKFGNFKECFVHFADALYFSALTLAGLGQEGQEVVAGPARLVHVYEALSGIVLIVVAISVYVGKRDGEA